VLNSNNIQDRPNVEMMIHLEGPIVESFYEAFLLSWNNALTPPPLTLNRQPANVSPAKTETGHENGSNQQQFAFGKDNENLQHIDENKSKEEARDLLKDQHADLHQGGSGEDGLSEKLSTQPVTHSAEEGAAHGQGQAVDDPTARANTDPMGDKTNDAEASKVDSELDLNEGGYDRLAKHLNAGAQPDMMASAKSGDASTFHPHILHAPHKPFPIAMACRKAHGRPGHGDVDNPQNVAWLAGFKFAQKKVFIQTPTFNFPLVVDATLDACRRGIEVILYLDLGFNDLGEQIPGQGGTNEDVVNHLYDVLNKEGKQAQLTIYWYVGKDQDVPLNASEKKRNCHVKFMAVDEQVAIVGNGNQDTQSWAHSQEINVMVDSKEVVAEWMHGLNANQNTLERGQVDSDGVWRHEDGKPLEGLTGGSGNALERIKGLTGAVARVRGKGGF